MTDRMARVNMVTVEMRPRMGGREVLRVLSPDEVFQFSVESPATLFVP